MTLPLAVLGAGPEPGGGCAGRTGLERVAGASAAVEAGRGATGVVALGEREPVEVPEAVEQPAAMVQQSARHAWRKTVAWFAVSFTRTT